MGKKLQVNKRLNPGQSITKFFDKSASQVPWPAQHASLAQSGSGPCKPVAQSNAAAAQIAVRATEATICGAAAAQTVPAKPAPAKLSAKQAAKVAKVAGGGSATTKPNSSKSAKPLAAAKQPVKQQQQQHQQQAKPQYQQAPAAVDPIKPQPQDRVCQVAAQNAARAVAAKSVTANQPDSRAAAAAAGKPEPSVKLLHHQAARQRSASPTDAAGLIGPAAAAVCSSGAAAQTTAAAADSVHTATTSMAHPKGAAAAVKGPLRAPRFNPYIPGSREHHHALMLMSQADDEIEVAWKPSPPKDLLAPAQQQQADQGAEGSGASHVAQPAGADATNSCCDPGSSAALQQGGSSGSSRSTKQQSLQQQQPSSLGSKGVTAAAAAAADSADDVLEQVLSSLSNGPQQQQPGAAGHAVSTPGGPRLRAFRNHSIVPPSTGTKATGRAPHCSRPCSSAAPNTAGGNNSSGRKTQHQSGSSTVRRKQAGLKRRDLLDLLDRVEGLVKRRRGDEDDDGSLQDVQGSESPRGLQQQVPPDPGVQDSDIDAILAELDSGSCRQIDTDGHQHQQQETPLPASKRAGTQDVAAAAVGSKHRGSRLSLIAEEDQQQYTPPPAARHRALLDGQQHLQQRAAVLAAEADHNAFSTPQQLPTSTNGQAAAAAEDTPAACPGPAAAAAAAGCVPATPHAEAQPSAETAVAATPSLGQASTAAAPLQQQECLQQQQQIMRDLEVGSSNSRVATGPENSGLPESASAAAAVAAAYAAAGLSTAASQQPLVATAEMVAAGDAVMEEDAAKAVAAAATPGVSSQQARATAAVKELEEFELLYGLDDEMDDDMTAAHAEPQQQQQQQQQQGSQQQQQQHQRLLVPDDLEQQQQVQPQQQQQYLPANKRRRTASPAAPAVEYEGKQQPAAAVVPAADLAGGRSEVYHLVLEVQQEVTDVSLRCFNPYKGTELYVHLSHPWSDCPVAAGDAANIIGGVCSTDDSGRHHVHLDHKQGMIIMHPDVLLSGTTITTALTCTRRAWLSERFAAAGGGPSGAALRGTLLHELLQRLLVDLVGHDTAVGTALPGVMQLQDMVHEVLSSFGEKLHEVGLTEGAAAADMNRHLDNISAWLRKYLPQQQQQQGQPHLQQTLQHQQQQVHLGAGSWSVQSNSNRSSTNSTGGLVDVGPNSGFDQPPRVLLQGVADIEESIWAPRYGLKGQVDASLLVSLCRRQQAPAAAGSGGLGAQQQQHLGQTSWGPGCSGQQQQQSGAPGCSGAPMHQVLGSGWSVAGSGGGYGPRSGGWNQNPGGGSGAGGFRGGRAAASSGLSSRQRPNASQGGGVFGDVRGTRHPASQRQRQQQQQSGLGTAVLQQLDLNAAAGALQQGSSALPTAAGTTAEGSAVWGVASPTAAAAGGPGADEPVAVFKGKLSGAVAATRAVQQSRASGQEQQQQDTELLIMPFEFKSGKDYFSHRAQVSLYLLLMEVRYQLGLLPAGLLWNVNSQNMSLVPAKQEEIAPLMACRNRLAVHLWQDVPPPPQMLGDSHTCARCHSAATCAAVHAVVEGGSSSSSGMDEAQWSSLAGAVSPAAAAWGSRWINCIDCEEAAGRSRRAEMWALTGAQRQARGNCIAGLQYVCSQPAKSAMQAPGDKVFIYTFRQLPSNNSSKGSNGSRTDQAVLETAAAEATAEPGLQCPAAVADPVDAVVVKSNCGSQQQAGIEHGCSCSSTPATDSSSSSSTLQGMPMAPGDVLILSADGMQVNVGRVEVMEVQGEVITVASHKALQLERYVPAGSGPVTDLVAQQAKRSRQLGDTPTAAACSSSRACGPTPGTAGVWWRLDRDEAASTGMFQRANVLRVASDSSSSRVIRLRKLLVDLVAPKQLPTDAQQSVLEQLQEAAAGGGAAQQQQQGSEQVGSAVAAATVRPAARLAMAAGRTYLNSHGSQLNADQVAVLHRVMQMQDYTLVLGMPGAGKTSTIVHAIRALSAAGASILVTSYTNSALDNILLKLIDSGVTDFVRLGRASSCHPRVQEFMPGGQRYPQRSTAELQQLAASTPIVGCPCLSVHHPLLAARPAFDVVIVDEAGQISLPAVLGALLKARSFVLVGDHYQLPPLVLDKRAAEGGLGISLFRQLCEAHPSAVVVLRRQYRMCGQVMGLANELVYCGQLVAGNEQVESAQLELINPDVLPQFPDWVSSLLHPSCHLAFINTDSARPPAAAEDSQAAAGSGGVVNAGEAAVVMQLLDGLLAAGVPGKNIGIISPYKAQVALLQQLLSSRHKAASCGDRPLPAASEAAAVEAMTIDKCQGRDKAVLLLSFVRSNPRGAVGNLLNDWQRLNVAITRAKVKLLMVGSARTLGGGVPLLQKMIGWIQQQGGLVELPADALQQQQQQQ